MRRLERSPTKTSPAVVDASFHLITSFVTQIYGYHVMVVLWGRKVDMRYRAVAMVGL